MKLELLTEVVVDQFGTFLGKKSERLVVRVKDEEEVHVPLHELREIVVATKGVTISSDLLQECGERGIMVHFLDFQGIPYATLSSPALVGTVLTRREQLLAYYDERAVQLVQWFLWGKLRNQENNLRYFAKYRRDRDLELYEKLRSLSDSLLESANQIAMLSSDRIDDVRGRLFGLEGSAADAYWTGLGCLLDPVLEFSGRKRRGATDAVNSCLNYGYGILYGKMLGALTRAGLDPFAGFLHVDRPGKQSLVLDFVEEFRACLIDRPLWGLLGRGWTPQMEGGQLSSATRRELVAKIRERLESLQTYGNQKLTLASIVQRQARSVAMFLRGESKYRPFVATW